MSKFTDLVMRADIAASVLVNEEGTDVELWKIRPCPTTDEELDELAHRLAGRDLRWIGVMGRVNGVPQVAFAVLPPPHALAVLNRAFDAYCNGIVPPVGDEIEWLEKLYALPDSRT